MAQKLKVRRTQRRPAPAVRRPAASKVDAEETTGNRVAAEKVSDAITTHARARADVAGGGERAGDGRESS